MTLSVVPETPDEPAPDDAPYSAVAVCEIAGISYRQLDFWCRTRYLSCSHPATGSGSARRFSADEVRVAVAIKRLLDVGFRPDAAARIARIPEGREVPAAIPFGPGVLVILDLPLWDTAALPNR